MSTKDIRDMKRNDYSASDHSVELNASSKVAKSIPSQSVSFENHTLSSYKADRESDTEDIPQNFPTAGGFMSIPKLPRRTEKDRNIDSSASQWLKQSSVTTSESDVESVQSINYGLGGKAEEAHNRSHGIGDEEFLDLSAEKDLQIKAEKLWEQVRSIQAILDNAQISNNPAINQEICSQIQKHALEIAGIFGDDIRDMNKLIEKSESEVSNLKSTNQSQKQQSDKLAADLARANGLVMELDKNAYELRIKQAMRTIENELAARVAKQQAQHSHQIEVSHLKSRIEYLQRLHSFEQDKNQKILLSQSNKRIATENELKEQKLRSEQMSIFYDALREQYCTLQRTVQEGNSRYRDLEAKYKEAKKELALAQNENGTLQVDLVVTKQQVLSGNITHERERREVSRNHVAPASLYSEKKMQLEAIQADLKNEIREVCTNNKSLKEENEELSALVLSLRERCTTIREILESCNSVDKTESSGQQLSSQTESVGRMPPIRGVLRDLGQLEIENINLKNEKSHTQLQIEEQKAELDTLMLALETEAYPLLYKMDANLTSALAQLNQERIAHLACAQKLAEAEKRCAAEAQRLG